MGLIFWFRLFVLCQAGLCITFCLLWIVLWGSGCILVLLGVATLAALLCLYDNFTSYLSKKKKRN